MIGGSLGGAGSIGSIGSPMNTIGSTTSSSVNGAAKTAGSQNVDRKSGTVSADRSADANAAGGVGQALATPARTVSGNASGAAAGSASGGANAQLIGTDALRSTVGGAMATSRTALTGAAATGRNTAGAVSGMAGSAQGSASGSADGMFSGAAGQLAAAGSLAAAGDGNFAVSKGMRILGPDGNRLGKVRGVIADAHGEVQQVLVKVDGETAMLPAANFSGSGSALVSAMGEGQIKQVAKSQDEAAGQ